MAVKLKSVDVPYFKWETRMPYTYNTVLESPVFSLDGSEWKFQLEIDTSWFQREASWKLHLKKMKQTNKVNDFLITVRGGKRINHARSVFKLEPSANYLLNLSQSTLGYYPFLRRDHLYTLHFTFDVSQRTMTTIPDEVLEMSEPMREELCNLPHLVKLSEDIQKLLDRKDQSDVVIKCGDRKFHAHKNILSARSDVFDAMFRSDMVESNSGVVDVSDMESATVLKLLKYLYSGKLDELSMESAFELYQAADKYAVRTLKQSCARFMADNLSVDVACSVLLLADRTAEDAQWLLHSTISFIEKHPMILKTAEWSKVAELNPELAKKIEDRCRAAKMSEVLKTVSSTRYGGSKKTYRRRRQPISSCTTFQTT